MELYFSRNSNPRLCVAAARYINAPVTYLRGDPTNPANRAKFQPLNPNLRVPILVDGDRTVWEGDAIICHLCQVTRSDFWPSNGLTEMIRWLSWSATHFAPPASFFYFERIVKPQFTDHKSPKSDIDREMKDFRKYATILNDAYRGREWMIGDRPSYADFRLAFIFPFAAGAGLPLAEFPELQRLSDQLDRIDAWRDPFAGLPE